MAIKNRPTQLNGINPLAYVGVNPYTPPAMYQLPRPPTVRDNAGFQIGDFWINDTNNDLWYLAKKSNQPQYQDALWVLLNNGADLETLTGDVGGPVGPDANRNINTLGTAGEILVTGTPGTNTLTWSLDGSVAQEFPTDSGTAIPAAGILNIIANIATTNCGATVEFTGAGNTVTLNVSDATSNTLIGLNAGNAVFNHASATSNTGVGVGVLQALTTGDENSAFGAQSLNDLTTGGNNTAVGSNVLSAITTGSQNIGIGRNSGTNYTTAESNNIVINGLGRVGESNVIRIGNEYTASSNDNIFVGHQSGISAFTVASALANLGIGSNTLEALTTGNQNVCVGNGTGAAITTGLGNTLIGANAGDAITTGDSNTAMGLVALTAMTTGIHNTAIGTGAMGTSTSGDQNTSIGYYSCDGLLTGSNNVSIGAGAGDNWAGAESNNIAIGLNVSVAADNNTLRIGQATGAAAGQLNKTFIHGIRGITTGVNDAIAVLVDSAGQLGTVSSSIRYKENVIDMDDYSSGLLELRPVTFNYKDRPGITEPGLIAEEVAEILPELVVYKDGQPETVKYHLLVNYLINELQKLEKRVTELESR